MLRLVRGRAANDDRAPTEVQLDNYNDFDAVIGNNGSVEELYELIDGLMERMAI